MPPFPSHTLANYSFWNKVSKITLNEFIYLAIGYDPEHINSKMENDLFKDYQYYERLKNEIPCEYIIDEEISTREDFYEATNLVKWYKDKGMYVSESYKPILSQEKQKEVATRKLSLASTLNIYEISHILNLFNPEHTVKDIKSYIISAIYSKDLTPTNPSYDYCEEVKDRNYTFPTGDLTKWAAKNSLNLPLDCSKDDNREVNTLHLTTLHKMITGLALLLNYDPKDNKSILTGSSKNSFEDRFEKHGVRLSCKTIRKVLTEAFEATEITKK